MNCCISSDINKMCKRKDGKVFQLPRMYSKNNCISNKIKGFSMKSSCAPYKFCKKKQFLYHPNNPNKSFNVYINKNPSNTISIKYKTYEDVRDTITKLERLYKNKKFSHKRIWQVAMIMKVRLETLYKYKNTKYKKALHIKKRFNLSHKYFLFLKKRTLKRSFENRKNMTFKF